jgi:hypothetical protein
VQWSQGAAPQYAGDIIDIPDALKIAATYLILSEVSINTCPASPGSSNKADGITLSDNQLQPGPPRGFACCTTRVACETK